MKQQHTLMRFDPATGEPKPYPSHADQWREWHGKAAWLFNPWTGDRRLADDVGSDVLGFLITPPGEPVYAANENQEKLELEKIYCNLLEFQEFFNQLNYKIKNILWPNK